MKATIIGISIDYMNVKSPGDLEPFKVDYGSRNTSQAVLAVGGLPVMLPVGDPDQAKLYAQMLDGLILSGGSDISPSLYQQDPQPQLGRTRPDRDAFELALLEAMTALKKPVLGICRGMQLINVAYGGTLHQHLPSCGKAYIQHVQKTDMHFPSHRVQCLADSYLNDLVGTASLPVNSLHHQGIDRLGEGLLASSTASDGLIESIEKIDSESSLLAVQWHPEEMYQVDAKQLAIFQDLIHRAERDRI